ncbi:MAG: hypothetical protein QW775_03535 [Ignisphaera sp.]|uniref:Uncharacterized protein n=1 Tax=Ignisphaera aggregans TaxID=334771 RepID=A0A7C4JIV3_9CREN
MINNLEARTTLLLFINMLGLSSADVVFHKALRSIDKGLSLTHVLAEVLLYSYLVGKGFEYASIEETIGFTKCDIYARQGISDICVEVETNVVPLEYILEGYDYIIARHVKKVIQTSKSNIRITSFAYPFGVIPLIPIELLKNPEERSREELEKLFNTARRFFNLDIEDFAYLKSIVLGDAYLYDVATLKVVPMHRNSLKRLISTYKDIFNRE